MSACAGSHDRCRCTTSPFFAASKLSKAKGTDSKVLASPHQHQADRLIHVNSFNWTRDDHESFFFDIATSTRLMHNWWPRTDALLNQFQK
jgi:hypothetical protein